MFGPQVALVTGSTWGLGLAIVQVLCQGFKWDVYLSTWDVQRGAVVVEDLQREGLKPRLDITDLADILAAWQHFMKEYGGLDVLINNTRIAPRQGDPASFGSQLLPLHVCSLDLQALQKWHRRGGASGSDEVLCCRGQSWRPRQQELAKFWLWVVQNRPDGS
uniref:Uncharacterized protein n=1 Tax=Oncorhynchus mykiss TaxID=8022 RepID=A0A8K9X4B1_ONCMY